jgi:protein-S-isoprenylcysteine O-methyltransferase Ste14
LPFNNFFFLITYFVWIVSEIVGAAILPVLRQKGDVKVRTDRGSRFAIFFGLFLAFVIGIIIANRSIGLLPVEFLYLGIAMVCLGIIIRQWAIATLGRFFSLSVRVTEGQKVISNGPYRFVRHPSYTGALLSFAGLGLALQSWVALLVILVMFGVVFGYRMLVEENTLKTQLGEAYAEYMKRTKRLVPFLI